MRNEDKKAATAAYKDRKTMSGIYTVRCGPTGRIWAGSADDIDKIHNRLWFTLRVGASHSRTLQEAWDEHGEDAFIFEATERFDQEPDAHVRFHMLKEKLAHWCRELDAERL